MGVSVLLSLLQSPLEPVQSAVFVSGTPKFVTSYDFHHGLPPAELRKITMDIKNNFLKGMQNFYSLLFKGEEVSQEQFVEVTRHITHDVALPPSYVALQCLESLGRSDYRDGLKNIHIPVLVTHGANDGVCRADAARFMADQLPNSELEIFDGVAHAPFLTRADAFNARVSQFLDR